jgi:hypothetical protein
LLQAADGQRIANLATFAMGAAGLVTDAAKDIREGQGAVEDAARFAGIAFGQAGHEGADIDMERAGRGTKGLLLLNTTGFKGSELRLFHGEVDSL